MEGKSTDLTCQESHECKKSNKLVESWTRVLYPNTLTEKIEWKEEVWYEKWISNRENYNLRRLVKLNSFKNLGENKNQTVPQWS